jgi:NAD(P)-dependent dehydrogenase (short-subunit alcohol dehydrogenase family)
MPRHWLITGVSSGLGRALADEALSCGDVVVGTVRRPEDAEELTSHEDAHAIVLDVTAGPAAVQHAFDAAVAMAGHVDVVVNNAGYGLVGAVEEVSDEEARRQMDTNFFGPLHLTQAALPHFRARGSGWFVGISSVAGIVGWAGNGLYSASKFALEGLYEALRREVAGHGIKVLLVEPGAFRTDWSGRSLVTAAVALPEYADVVATRSWPSTVSGTEAGDPAAVARAVIAALEADQPPVRLALGPDAVAVAQRALQDRTRDLDGWRAVSLATGFPD